MYNKLVAELVMGRVGYGPSLYGPSWLWAEFVIGRVCYGPRCQVTYSSMQNFMTKYLLLGLILTNISTMVADPEGIQGVHSNSPLELNYFIFMENFRKK